MCYKQMHKTLAKEYLQRTKVILKTYLSQRNKIKAINQLMVPVFQYSYGIINWPQSEINKLDTKTRKLLTIHKKPVHPKNVPAETRGRERLDGTQPGAQSDEYRTSWVREMLNKLSDSICKQTHEHNKPENVSLTRLTRNFQKQVRIEDATQENDTATNTAPTIAKKDEININKYTTTERTTKEQENTKK